MKEKYIIRGKRFFAMIVSLFIIGSLVMAGFLVESTVEAETNEAEKRIVAYYTNWANYERDFHVLDLDVSNITHIIYAFGDFCWEGEDNRDSPPETNACFDYKAKEAIPNGTVVSSDTWADFDNVDLTRLTSEEEETWELDYHGNLGAFHKLKQDYPDLKVLFSLGGWTLSKHFSNVVADEGARSTFVETAVDFIREYDLDGIDIDWEYPVGGGAEGNSNHPDDKQNHTLLLQALRDELDQYEAEDGKEYELSIASSANPDYLENNEMDKIGEILDFINIMTYDFYIAGKGVSGHNAPLFNDPSAEVPGMAVFNVKAAIEGHLNAGIPPEKLVMGMAAYGRSWAGCDGEYTACSEQGKGTWEDGTVDYDHVMEKMSDVEEGYTRHWNDVAKVPYLTNEAGEFISFDDVESVKLKAALAKEYDLGGAMFWELSQDRQNDLIHTTVKVFNDEVFDAELVFDTKDGINAEKDQLVTGFNKDKTTGFEVKFPVNLPHDTKFNVQTGMEDGHSLPEGYIYAGGNFVFELAFPEAVNEVYATYELSLSVDEDATNPAIFYYDEAAEVWEKLDDASEVKDDMITTQVSDLSKYAVLGEGKAPRSIGIGMIITSVIILFIVMAVGSLIMIRRKENAEDW